MARCCKRIYAGLYGHDCKRDGSVIRDGKPYCKQHDPVARAERAAARNAKWDAESQQKQKAWDRQLRIAKACDGLTAEEVEHAIKQWKAFARKDGNGAA